jgi:tetratricopeptide (TPR) repeat protein
MHSGVFTKKNVLLRSLVNKTVIAMRLLALFVVIFVSAYVYAQTATEADAFFNKRQYAEAGQIYAQLLQKQPLDPLFNYRYARCCYELKDFDNAIKYFIAGGSRYPLRDYYLADSYFWSYRFADALQFFESYSKSAATNSVIMRDVEQKVRRTRLALEMMKKVAEIEIIDSIKSNKAEFIKFYSLSRETGTISQKLLNLPGSGNIDLITWMNEKGDFQLYSDTLNNAVKILKSSKMAEGWSNGELLPAPVNSGEYSSNYPFMMSNGLLFFFASNNEHSIGGYDIFYSKRNDYKAEFANSINIGMPFNSLYNDYMLVVDEMSNTGWFVSDRFQPENKVVIYQFVFTGTDFSFISNAKEDELRNLAMLTKSRKPLFKEALEQPVVQVAEQVVQPVTPNVRTARATRTSPARTNEPERATEVIAFQFVINDELVYTQLNHFKSQKALTAWNDTQKMMKELSTYETRLRQIRSEYEEVEERVERLRLTNEISSLEKAVVRLKIQIEEKEKVARNEEIMTLLKAQIN